jgi:hypothetical protein
MKRTTRPKNHHRLGDAPIEDAQRERMNKIATFLDRQFNGDNAQPHALLKEDKREWGFVMLVFRFGDDPKNRCNFISNGADRKEIITLFKEMIARFEGQPEMEGHA